MSNHSISNAVSLALRTGCWECSLGKVISIDLPATVAQTIRASTSWLSGSNWTSLNANQRHCSQLQVIRDTFTNIWTWRKRVGEFGTRTRSANQWNVGYLVIVLQALAHWNTYNCSVWEIRADATSRLWSICSNCCCDKRKVAFANSISVFNWVCWALVTTGHWVCH